MGNSKLLLVHHRGELGGAPRSLAALAERLAQGYDVHAYAPPGPAAELLASAGARVHVGPVAAFTHIWASTYSGRRWLLLAREAARLPGHVRALGALLRRERFALVHLNDSPLVPAAWLARRSGARVVWHLRSSLPGEGSDVRSRLVAGAVARLADRAIAINEDVASSFARVPRVEVVYNGVDLDRFAPADPGPARAELGLPADRPLAAFCGFLYAHKGYPEFLDAAARVRGGGLDAHFLLVGGGVRPPAFFGTRRGRALASLRVTEDALAAAHALAGRLELRGAVTFLPYTPAVERVYAAADIVVAPARGPELGRQTIEAAASGRPLVTTGSRTGGGVVLQGETGLLVPPGDPAALADAIAGLLGSPDDRARMGAAARAHAERHFDAAAGARRIGELYEEVLAAPARHPRAAVRP